MVAICQVLAVCGERSGASPEQPATVGLALYKSIFDTDFLNQSSIVGAFPTVDFGKSHYVIKSHKEYVSIMTDFNGYENTVGQVGRIWLHLNEGMVELITVEDAAKEFNLSERTIQRHLDEGKLIGLKISGIWFAQRWEIDYVAETLDDIPF